MRPEARFERFPKALSPVQIRFLMTTGISCVAMIFFIYRNHGVSLQELVMALLLGASVLAVFLYNQSCGLLFSADEIRFRSTRIRVEDISSCVLSRTHTRSGEIRVMHLEVRSVGLVTVPFEFKDEARLTAALRDLLKGKFANFEKTFDL